MRRTSSLDFTRPDGLDLSVTVMARARDLLTDAHGDAVVLARARAEASISKGGQLLELRSSPEVPASTDLVGGNLLRGFRRRLTDVLGDEARRTTLLNLLLDDLPVASMVSGVAIQRGADGPPKTDLLAGHVAATTGICAGWAEGATIVEAFTHHGEIPAPLGPAAPRLERSSDPVGWHPVDDLPAHSTRRRRCTDLWRVAADTDRTFGFETHFRDTYVDAEGYETVVHEYLVTGSIDAASMTFSTVEAQARVLPWVECPGAVASARRLVGRPVGDVRTRVLADYRGTSTCTHLNDTLRTLADLPAMAARISGEVPPPLGDRPQRIREARPPQ